MTIRGYPGGLEQMRAELERARLDREEARNALEIALERLRWANAHLWVDATPAVAARLPEPSHEAPHPIYLVQTDDGQVQAAIYQAYGAPGTPLGQQGRWVGAGGRVVRWLNYPAPPPVTT